MPTVSLAQLLGAALRRLWPACTQRELLLDLGEHKVWDLHDEDVAIGRFAEWLALELVLPPHVETIEPATVDEGAELAPLRLLVSQHREDGNRRGVARWVVELAPLAGTQAKTLANTLSKGLRPHRSDHRWLRVISRICRGGSAPLNAWCFRLRSADAVIEQLARLAQTEPLDAGDALLLYSLVALWQRRRPSEESRANRGQRRGRRATPKPLASLAGTLIQPGQIAPLGGLAGQLGGEVGRGLQWGHPGGRGRHRGGVAHFGGESPAYPRLRKGPRAPCLTPPVRAPGP